MEAEIVPLLRSNPGRSATENPLQLGCDPYSFQTSADVSGRIVLVLRGGCTFLQKAEVAESAGAVALGIVTLNDELIPMVASSEMDLIGIPVFSVTLGTGSRIINQVLNSHSRYTQGILQGLNDKDSWLMSDSDDVETGFYRKSIMNLYYSGKPLKNLIIIDEEKFELYPLSQNTITKMDFKGASLIRHGQDLLCLLFCIKEKYASCKKYEGY